MTKIAVRIQHHPSRVAHLQYLLTGLEGQQNDFDFKIIESTEGTWDGCKKCLKSGLRSGCEYVLVLQDDILPCRDFLYTVQKIADRRPYYPITFFTNSPSQEFAETNNYRWVRLRVWFMAQAYLFPTNMIEDFFDWTEAHAKPELVDDERLALYVHKKNIPVLATVPSLVEHLGWRTTTIGGRNSKAYTMIARRVANSFIGFEKSGLDINWSEVRTFDDMNDNPSIFTRWYKE